MKKFGKDAFPGLDPCNPLIYHKTAKAFFGNPCERFGNHWRKRLETAFISPPPLLPCFRGYINRQPTFAALGLGSVAASSLFIHTIRTWGVWSPIDLLSPFTLPTVPLAVVYARRFVFALVIAGLFTLRSGRIITR